MNRKQTLIFVGVLACTAAVIQCFFGSAINMDLPYEPAESIDGKSSQPTTTTTTASTTITTEPERAHYYLTPTERDTVERVVMAEAGGESYLGQMAVAQCILNACYASGIRPGQAVIDYAYAKSRPDPSESVKAAVSAVFDDGEMAVAEDILYFYAPERVSGEGHERRHEYVCTIGGHKFFKEATE